MSPENTVNDNKLEVEIDRSNNWTLVTLIIVVINFSIIVAILVIIYRRKRRRIEKEETITASNEPEPSLNDNTAAQTDPETQEQEQNLRHSTGEQENSVVITDYNKIGTRLENIRREDTQHPHHVSNHLPPAHCTSPNHDLGHPSPSCYHPKPSNKPSHREEQSSEPSISALVYEPRDPQEGTITTLSGSAVSQIDNTAAQLDPESQEQEQSLRHSVGEQDDSVVITVDVHPQLQTRLENIMREDTQHPHHVPNHLPPRHGTHPKHDAGYPHPSYNHSQPSNKPPLTREQNSYSSIFDLVYEPRNPQEGTITTSSESEGSLNEDAAAQSDPETQKQEQNLRHSINEKDNSVVVGVDVHPPQSTRLGSIRNEVRQQPHHVPNHLLAHGAYPNPNPNPHHPHHPHQLTSDNNLQSPNKPSSLFSLHDTSDVPKQPPSKSSSLSSLFDTPYDPNQPPSKSNSWSSLYDTPYDPNQPPSKSSSQSSMYDMSYVPKQPPKESSSRSFLQNSPPSLPNQPPSKSSSQSSVYDLFYETKTNKGKLADPSKKLGNFNWGDRQNCTGDAQHGNFTILYHCYCKHISLFNHLCASTKSQYFIKHKEFFI